jgi:DNA-directed RNA polymerase subunit RPC12/RpoP
MVTPERVFRTRFKRRVCARCKIEIMPIANGSNPMHGYKLECPECGAYLGWGGKIFKEHQDTAED